MKNLDRLLIILAILTVIACRCNSDLFGLRRNQNTPTPTPDSADPGEYRQCSERPSLNHNNRGAFAPLTINNESQSTVKVYRLGPDNYQSQYNSLTPGNSVTQRSSSRGEWWMITDAKGNCQMIVSPPNTVNIK